MNISNADNANNNINNNNNNNNNEENTQSQYLPDATPFTKRKRKRILWFAIPLSAVVILVGVVLAVGVFDSSGIKASIQENLDKRIEASWLSVVDEAEERTKMPASFIFGLYRVGDLEDWEEGSVLPGTWVAAEDHDDCYWAILRDGSGLDESIVQNYFGLSIGQKVELRSGQYFETDDCGEWELETASNT